MMARICRQIALILSIAFLSRATSFGQTDSTEDNMRFKDFLTKVAATKDSSTLGAMIDSLITNVRRRGTPVIEGSTVYFLYQGNAKRIAVPGDINGWSPSADTMKRIPRTNLYYLAKTIDRAARFEYKLNVDSVWILDPLNAQHVMGGYGPNSEIRMPLYRAPQEVLFREDIAPGRVDTTRISSKLLRRSHPVFVYLPNEYRKHPRKRYPTLYVTDGGEYLLLASMKNVLDNLIADKRIQPIIAVFVDPRTDLNDVQTSKRMHDYTMSDTFVNFLTTEVRARLSKKYRMDLRADQTGIMGASLGGLISTYAAFTRPDVFGLAAAQSPSYWWRDDSLIKMIDSAPRRNIKFYIDTGTIRDAQEQASRMVTVMRRKNYEVHYEEHPEGHNWINWRARISHILEYFWGTQ